MEEYPEEEEVGDTLLGVAALLTVVLERPGPEWLRRELRQTLERVEILMNEQAWTTVH